MPRVTGVVLAAGAGTRMGTPKADLAVNGERLLDRAITVLRAAGCDPVIAVVRVGTHVPDAIAVVNDDPDRGMRSSLALAIAACDDTDPIAVMLVDTPGIGPDAVREVLTQWRPGRITIGTYKGLRSHPTVMAKVLWDEALELAAPDEGARELLKKKPELVDEVPVKGDPRDLDTRADMDSWKASPGENKS